MSQTLQLLLQQAERARDAAQARHAQAHAQAQHAALQAEQLVQYRDEYRRRAPALQGRQANIELVRCHQGFMQRLDQAIAQQQQQLQALRQQAESERALLLERETQLAALRRLAERRAQEARRAGARREQDQNDEAALRLALAAVPGRTH
jgi:flagellar FliJ protein